MEEKFIVVAAVEIWNTVPLYRYIEVSAKNEEHAILVARDAFYRQGYGIVENEDESLMAHAYHLDT